jgi:hypothetical protein
VPVQTTTLKRKVADSYPSPACTRRDCSCKPEWGGLPGRFTQKSGFLSAHQLVSLLSPKRKSIQPELAAIGYKTYMGREGKEISPARSGEGGGVPNQTGYARLVCRKDDVEG